MWFLMALASAILLGSYDVAKKQSLRRNSVMWVLLAVSVLSTAILSPSLRIGTAHDHLLLVPKAILVTLSWISGLIAMKLLPLTTVSTLKASRPVFVVILSIIIFSEKLNFWQWSGTVIALTALFLLSRSSKKEGIHFLHNRGFSWMVVSIFTGVGSALLDKYVIHTMEPFFVQGWTNLYVCILMGLVVLFKALRDGKNAERFHWDWMLLIVAVLLTGADALYFCSLKQEGALLSVISILRRGSVIVTFTLGAILFKERNIRAKALDLALLLFGMALLAYGSSPV